MTPEQRKVHNRKMYIKHREKRLNTQKEYYHAHKNERAEYNRQYNLDNKDSLAAKKKEYREQNSEHRKVKMREWYEKNKDYAKVQAKAYRDANKDKMREWSKQYRSERYKSDPVALLTYRIRTLIFSKFYAGGFTKKSRTFDILGCSYDDFLDYISASFKEGMSWDNYGEWHLDHKVPVGLAENEEQVIKLNHYTNFQPLWKMDNLIKGSLLLPEFEELKNKLLS